MKNIPTDFIENVNVGGTSKPASDNSGLKKGMAPAGVEAFEPHSFPASKKDQWNDSVLNTKATVIGGTPMGK